MTQQDAITALIKLIAHATEAHPHFECPRGQKDIAEARAALDVLLPSFYDWRSHLDSLGQLDDRIAVRTARITEPTYI